MCKLVPKKAKTGTWKPKNPLEVSQNPQHARKVRIGMPPSSFATPLMEKHALREAFSEHAKSGNSKIFPDVCRKTQGQRPSQNPILCCRNVLAQTEKPRNQDRPSLRARTPAGSKNMCRSAGGPPPPLTPINILRIFRPAKVAIVRSRIVFPWFKSSL